MLWLAERRVCMRVCKHVCASRCFAFRALIMQARIWKRFWVKKNSTRLIYLPICSSAETWKIFRNMLCGFLFFAWAEILSKRNPYFGKHLFCKARTDYAHKHRVQDFATGKNFSVNQCSKQECFAFFFLVKLFYKSNRKRFSCVCISWYKHSRGWENSRQLCKPSTSSRVCITVSNSPNPSRVYIRICKHGKHFLLLKYIFYIL